MFTSTDIVCRPLLGKEIRQCRKTKYLCATDLLELYNKGKTEKEKKRVQDFSRLDITKAYSDFLKGDPSTPLESIVSKRGNKGATRMHPKMFIDFACRLSVDFKDRVYTIALDKLIEARNANSEAFKKMMDATKNHIGYGYAEEVTMINKLVTGSIAPNQRKRLPEEKQAEMERLQETNTTLINMEVPYEKRLKFLKEYVKSM